MHFTRKVLQIVAQVLGAEPKGSAGLVATFLPGSLNSEWVYEQIVLLESRGVERSWVTREAIVYLDDLGDFRLIFPGGDPQPLSQIPQLHSLNPGRLEACLQLVSPGMSRQTFEVIVRQNLIEQDLTLRLAAMNSDCRECCFYHGRDGIVCAVHPMGKADCPDSRRRDRE